MTDSNYGFTDGTFSAYELKDEVEKALNQHFGYQGVKRHDKCIKVIGNTYRVDADVVPAYRYRDYSYDYRFDENNYIKGIEIRPDSGGKIINYPEQHIANGTSKNKLTDFKFKKCVRIIKCIKEDMLNAGIYVPNLISSFGLESLLWNVENEAYKKYYTLAYVFDEVVKFLSNDSLDNYKEANGIKNLFKDSYEKQVYKNFILNLNQFYNYEI